MKPQNTPNLAPNLGNVGNEEELERERARNRELMPQTAAMMDEYRRVFGPDVRLLYASENGREVGTPRAHDNAYWRARWRERSIKAQDNQKP